jgi:ATP-dependent protease ClpP protease subunit
MEPTPTQPSEPVASAVQTFSAPPQGWYVIHAPENAAEAEVRIYDAIGGMGISAESFVRDLAKIKAKTINVRLNTPGGEVFAGTAIHNALVEHPARIVVHVDGVAASAGSFIAMAGDEVRMADNAFMMIHNARGGVMGESDDLRRYADTLEKMSNVIAGMYERKTGKPRDHWRGLMDAETWFTAEEAKAEGLADTVYAAGGAPAKAKASFDFTIYNKIPDPVREMWGLKQPAAPVAATQTNNPPVVAPVEGVPAPVIPQPQEPIMATETVPVTPAPAPVAAPTANAPVQPTVAAFEAVTAQNHHTRGVADGRAVERQAQITLLRELVAAAPGKPQLAITAFLSEPQQSAANVAMAFNAARDAEHAAAAQIAAMQLETARQVALASAGGYPGGVAANVKSDEPDLAFAPNTPPETQAKMEWDGNYKNCRNSGATEKQYMLTRLAQLNGQVRAFSK